MYYNKIDLSKFAMQAHMILYTQIWMILPHITPTLPNTHTAQNKQ